MAYQLHVSRADFWAENAGQWIAADEWLAVVASDPALVLGETDTAYRAWVRDGDTAVGWIDWEKGNLVSAYPDERTFAKLLELAGRFGAQVRGDDGELYRTMSDFPGTGPWNDKVRPRGVGLPVYLRRRKVLEWAGIALVVLAVIAANLFDWW